MTKKDVHKIVWLAARVSCAEKLLDLAEQEKNEEAADFFERKLSDLEGQRPDPVDDDLGNHLFWELVSEWGVNLGVKGYGDK